MRCIDGMVLAQVTKEIQEDWSTLKRELPVTVRLEKKGQAQQHFTVGDEIDLVIKVQNYEPGFIAHVCLPDALARIVGGGQVKRFSLDFCGKNELHVPLVAVGSTELSAVGKKDELRQWWGMDKDKGIGQAQHWAVIVRNMFKEEQVGNPGLLQIVVREKVAV